VGHMFKSRPGACASIPNAVDGGRGIEAEEQPNLHSLRTEDDKVSSVLAVMITPRAGGVGGDGLVQ